MKLLFLATCGKKDYEEEPHFLNLYFSSLRKYIIPFFDTKVILFNSSLLGDSKNSKTYKLIKDYNLQDVVELKSIDELELPEKSVSFLKNLHWMSRIGLIMNVLFDYAKNKNFFNADWVFHTDTDIRFLENFQNTLYSINNLTVFNPNVVITLSGDAFYENIRYNNKMYAFYPPTRINFYTDTELSSMFNISKLHIEHKDNYVTNTDKLIYSQQQQKIRNDFVGISNYACRFVEFNWVSYNYSYNMSAITPEGEELEEWWNEFGNPNLDFRITHDKGSIPQMLLQLGHTDAVKVQLPSHSTMAYHYGSGWEGNDNFLSNSIQALREEFIEYQDIWEKNIS